MFARIKGGCLALLLAVAATGLSACVHPDEMWDNWNGVASNPPLPKDVAAATPTTVILVHVDGVTAADLDRGAAPSLKALADGGAYASRLEPVKGGAAATSALLTGRLPGRPAVYGPPTHPIAVAPIWETAARSGIRTDVETSAGGPPDARVDHVLAALGQSGEQAPGFVVLALEVGPGASVGQVDAAIGRLAAGLRARRAKVDLIIASHPSSAEGPGGILIANGADVFPGEMLKPCAATDVYGFLARILDITPQPNDGRPERLYAALRR